MLTYKTLLSTLEAAFETHFCCCHVKTPLRWVEFLIISCELGTSANIFSKATAPIPLVERSSKKIKISTCET